MGDVPLFGKIYFARKQGLKIRFSGNVPGESEVM
jgi:hypothetical protein